MSAAAAPETRAEIADDGGASLRVRSLGDDRVPVSIHDEVGGAPAVGALISAASAARIGRALMRAGGAA